MATKKNSDGGTYVYIIIYSNSPQAFVVHIFYYE